MGKKGILFSMVTMLACVFLLMPVTSYSEDGAGGKWDWRKKQIYELNAYQIKPPEGVGSNYTLKIGQDGKTTELLGDVIIERDIVTLSGAATTLTSAYSGKVIMQAAGTEQEVDLPADPTGCDFLFIKNGTAEEFRLDPNSTDQIINTNAAAGDYYTSVSAYGMIRLIGVSTSAWIAKEPTGTWKDQ